MALLNPDHQKTVVAIGHMDKENNFICGATGFLVGFIAKNSKDPKKREYHLFLLTNRHVFEKRNSIYLRFNKQDGKAETVNIPLQFPSKEKKWLSHKNEKIDLALLTINPTALKHKKITFHFFNEEMFAYHQNFEEIGIAVGDETFILGFPMGIAGNVQNYPYVKSGIVSRFDNELLRGNKAFLIDSSVFPGNSGGPVILKPTPLSIGKTKAVNSAYLLGAIAGYLPYQEKLWSHQTNPPQVVSIEREHSGLSFVVPMDYVKEIYSNWLEKRKKLENKETPEKPLDSSEVKTDYK